MSKIENLIFWGKLISGSACMFIITRLDQSNILILYECFVLKKKSKLTNRVLLWNFAQVYFWLFHWYRISVLLRYTKPLIGYLRFLSLPRLILKFSRWLTLQRSWRAWIHLWTERNRFEKTYQRCDKWNVIFTRKGKKFCNNNYYFANDIFRISFIVI